MNPVQEAYDLMVERIVTDSFKPKNVTLDRKIRTDLAYAELENYQAKRGTKKVLDRIPGFTWTDTRLNCTITTTVQ